MCARQLSPPSSLERLLLPGPEDHLALRKLEAGPRPLSPPSVPQLPGEVAGDQAASDPEGSEVGPALLPLSPVPQFSVFRLRRRISGPQGPSAGLAGERLLLLSSPLFAPNLNGTCHVLGRPCAPSSAECGCVHHAREQNDNLM